MAEATKHSEVIDVTQETFEKEVMQSELPVVVDCYATWCPPCKILSPILDELAGDYAGKIKVAKFGKYGRSLFCRRSRKMADQVIKVFFVGGNLVKF